MEEREKSYRQTDKETDRKEENEEEKGKQMRRDYIIVAVHSPSADCPLIHKITYSLIHAIHARAKTRTEAIDLATKREKINSSIIQELCKLSEKMPLFLSDRG